MVKALQEVRVAFFVEGAGELVCGFDKEFFGAAEEWRNTVDETGGGVVGAAAGVGAAFSQFAQFAGGGSVATVGNNPLLARAVDAVVDVAEVELRLISNADKARAGEEIAVCRHPYFAFSDGALGAGGTFF